MTKQKVLELLSDAPIVAAIKNDEGLARCLVCSAQVVFVLYGSVLDLPDIVKQLHSAGKAAIVHIDLIEGLSARDVAVDFIAQATGADGVISTRPALVKRAMENNLLAIRRFFLLDSLALHNIQRQLVSGSADLVEILPGIMPKMIRKIAENSPLPLIAGGLILDKEDIVGALSAGAVAVSSTNPELWGL